MKQLFLALIFSAAGAMANETISIAASPIPHAEILKFAQPILAKQGITLKISEFSDYVTPNLAVFQQQLDANFFQHQPYLNQFNHDRGTNLVALVKVQIEPMGVYADSVTEVAFIHSKQAHDIVNGSKIGVPNDPTNEGRALNILQQHGLIKLKSGVAYPSKKDITANPYKVQIIELDPAMLPRMLNSHQLGVAVINSNFALQANLNPTKDAVILESRDSPFANIVALRPDELTEPKMQALAKVLNSSAMKQFIAQKYHGALIAAF